MDHLLLHVESDEPSSSSHIYHSTHLSCTVPTQVQGCWGRLCQSLYEVKIKDPLFFFHLQIQSFHHRWKRGHWAWLVLRRSMLLFLSTLFSFMFAETASEMAHSMFLSGIKSALTSLWFLGDLSCPFWRWVQHFPSPIIRNLFQPLNNKGEWPHNAFSQFSVS